LVLFVLALREIGAARTGAYFSTAPFIGAVVGIVALREPLTLGLIAAGLLMSFGVYLHLTESRQKANGQSGSNVLGVSRNTTRSRLPKRVPRPRR